jgi:hypothetical protein
VLRVSVGVNQEPTYMKNIVFQYAHLQSRPDFLQLTNSCGSSDLFISVLLILNDILEDIIHSRGLQIVGDHCGVKLGMIDDFSSNRRRAGVERHDNIPNVPREVVSRQGNCSVERENTAVQLLLQLSRLL